MNFIQARNYTKASRTAIDLIVIHTMESPDKPGTAENVAAWFAGPSAPMASAHYCVDQDSVVQTVHDHDVAWHAPGANSNGIGIEHAGYAKRTHAEWAAPSVLAMLELSAALSATLCARWDIPVVRLSPDDLKAKKRGLCGHIDCTNAFSKGKGHWDPGPAFPWDWYLERVASYIAAAGAPRGDRDSHGESEAPPTDPRLATLWVPVGNWLVAPTYIYPVGIGEAVPLAAAAGCALPSPELVDAIWAAADLKVEPIPRNFTHWTQEEMSSPATITDQAARIAKAIAGRPFSLLAGTHKDVVMKDGRLGIYGWHRPNGKAIQGFFAGHAASWKDYSQGLRLVKAAR